MFLLFMYLQFCRLAQNQGKDKPFPKRQILDSLKLKEFADDNLKFVENG